MPMAKTIDRLELTAAKMRAREKRDRNKIESVVPPEFRRVSTVLNQALTQTSGAGNGDKKPPEKKIQTGEFDDQYTCPSCGAELVRFESCYRCKKCGWTKC